MKIKTRAFRRDALSGQMRSPVQPLIVFNLMNPSDGAALLRRISANRGPLFGETLTQLPSNEMIEQLTCRQIW
jgi:hypothetical protein